MARCVNASSVLRCSAKPHQDRHVEHSTRHRRLQPRQQRQYLGGRGDSQRPAPFRCLVDSGRSADRPVPPAQAGQHHGFDPATVEAQHPNRPAVQRACSCRISMFQILPGSAIQSKLLRLDAITTSLLRCIDARVGAQQHGVDALARAPARDPEAGRTWSTPSIT